MSRRGYRVLLSLVLCHLGLVALGAAYFDFDSFGAWGQLFEYYGKWSGAGNSYGFFAPGVGSDFRAQFDVLEPNGKTIPVQLQTGVSHEADLRVGNMVEQLLTDDEDADEVRRSVAASFAGTIFGRYPDAQAVTVRLQEFQPVSMADYRSGERPEWETIYEAKFAANAPQQTAEARP